MMLLKMDKVKNKLISEIRFLVVNYVVVPALGVLVCLLEAFGRIKFVHFERFPIWEGGLIIVSNHPSLLEPWILPLMGFPWMNFPWVFFPIRSRVKFSLRWFKELQEQFSMPKKLIPANVPDRENFFDHGWWRLFQGINISVNRNGGPKTRVSTILALKKILEDGGRVLIFPEGGRTFKAEWNGKLMSTNGRELGKLKDGAAWLATKTGTMILPVWVEGTDKVLPNHGFPFPRLWHRVTIKTGSPFSVNGNAREEATFEIARALLQLADEIN